MPYELPQVIAQIPSPPMGVPMPIRTALLIDGENKAVNYLIHREYELNKLHGLNCRRNIALAETKFTLPLKEKEDLEVPSIGKRRNKWSSQSQQDQLPILKL